MKIENIMEQTLLYDFYGELLTDHQKRIYEDVVFNDLSLTEVAEQEGISRQGVHDSLKNAEKSLEDYESKLGLVEKFSRTTEAIEEIDKRIDSLILTLEEGSNTREELKKIRNVIDNLEE